MTADQKDIHSRTRLEVINWLQLTALICGLVVGAMAIGRKDAEIQANTRALDQLQDITADLTKHAVRSEAQMQDLVRRIALLEQQRRN